MNGKKVIKKTWMLGVKLEEFYKEKIERLRIQNGDTNWSQTARRILCKELNKK